MKRTSQEGFSVVEASIVVLVVGVLGFAGYMVYSRQQNNNKPATTSNSTQTAEESPTADVGSAPEIKTTGDLTKAEGILDQTDPGSSDTDAGQLDGETSAF